MEDIQEKKEEITLDSWIFFRTIFCGLFLAGVVIMAIIVYGVPFLME